MIPRSGRTPGEGNGTLLLDSCLGNPMDRGTWDHKESDTSEQLTHTHTHTHTLIDSYLYLGKDCYEQDIGKEVVKTHLSDH